MRHVPRTTLTMTAFWRCVRCGSGVCSLFAASCNSAPAQQAAPPLYRSLRRRCSRNAAAIQAARAAGREPRAARNRAAGLGPRARPERATRGTLFTWKAVTFWIGGQLTLAQAHSSAQTVDSQAVARAVTERLTSVTPQISFNFGTGDGWSYISGGIGPTIWSVVPEGRAALPPDEERLQTINYGGGARWFVKPHLAFTSRREVPRYQPLHRVPWLPGRSPDNDAHHWCWNFGEMKQGSGPPFFRSEHPEGPPRRSTMGLAGVRDGPAKWRPHAGSASRLSQRSG